jgi:hypothetical protein
VQEWPGVFGVEVRSIWLEYFSSQCDAMRICLLHLHENFNGIGVVRDEFSSHGVKPIHARRRAIWLLRERSGFLRVW